MNRENILKLIIITSGLFFLFIFLAIRFLPVYNFIMVEKMIPEYWDKTKYGELYYFNHISHFKEKLPPAKTKFQFKEKHSTLNNSDIIAFGDSYFDFSRNKQFPERLHDKLGVNVHFRKGDDILAYLAKNKYESPEPAILLYERTERWIPLMLDEKPTDDFFVDTRNDFRKKVATIRDKIFYDQSEILYDALLRRSVFTAKMYEAIATLKFDLFNYISPFTPKYYLQDTIPWLFYYDQLNDEPTSFYYHHSDKEISNICNNIDYLSNTLWNKYNIKLVFLPLPAKYTLYHDMLNNHEYNNFIPRLYKCLEEKDILFVKVYEEYMNAEELIFYGTDEHWTEHGVEIAFNKTLEVLKNDPVTNKILSNSPK